MSKPFFITKENLSKLLQKLSGTYEVFVPVKKGTQRFYARFSEPCTEMVVGEVRAFEPLKAFFSRAREVVAQGFGNAVPDLPEKPYAIVGVKACDLKGFKVQDFVFYSRDCQDPFYAKNRDANLIISSDCTCTIATCFCLALGVQPSPQENFDINLSPVSEGFVVSVGSPKGEAVVKKHRDLLVDPSAGSLLEQTAIRNRVIQDVEKNISDNTVPSESNFEGIIERNFRSQIWEEEAKTCVECGACNTICPTCHCFLLYDQNTEEASTGRGAGQSAVMERFRIWDSCMIKDFARVAGGANPMAKLWMRLRNRFEKKFDFFPKVAQVYACTGCGRCISACPAKIDIRRVLRRLVNNA